MSGVRRFATDGSDHDLATRSGIRIGSNQVNFGVQGLLAMEPNRVTNVVEGDVLIQDGHFAPFIVEFIERYGGNKFDITGRREIDTDGSWCGTKNRRIRSDSIRINYSLLSHKFGDAAYINWCKEERGGLFLRATPPEKQFHNQISIVKAVFFRQNRYLNPGLSAQEIEKLWVEQYFPLYCQVLFELRQQFNKTSILPPLNCDPPNPPTPVTKEFADTVYKADSYLIPKPVVAPAPVDAAPPKPVGEDEKDLEEGLNILLEEMDPPKGTTPTPLQLVK